MAHELTPTLDDDAPATAGAIVAMVLTKIADRSEVWLLIGNKVAESHVMFEQAVEFAGTSDADGVAENKNFQQ